MASNISNWIVSPLHINRTLWITITAATSVMGVSLVVSLWVPGVAKDVLPFATGLVGFAAGLITAIFGIYLFLEQHLVRPGEEETQEVPELDIIIKVH